MEKGCETGCGVHSRQRSRPLPGTYRQGELLVLPRPLDERWLRPRSRAAPVPREPPSEEGNGPGPSVGSGPRAGSSKTLPSLGPARSPHPTAEEGGPWGTQPHCQPGAGRPPCGDPALLAAGAPGLGQRRWHQPPPAQGDQLGTASPAGHSQPHGRAPQPGGRTALVHRSAGSPMAQPLTRGPPPAAQPGTARSSRKATAPQPKAKGS